MAQRPVALKAGTKTANQQAHAPTEGIILPQLDANRDFTRLEIWGVGAAGRTKMPKSKGLGRRKGSRNRGYFYRENRGWFTKLDAKFVPLEDEQGARLKDRHTPDDVVKAAARNLA